MAGDRYLIINQHDIYFLTFTVVEWIDVFTRKDYKLTRPRLQRGCHGSAFATREYHYY